MASRTATSSAVDDEGPVPAALVGDAARPPGGGTLVASSGAGPEDRRSLVVNGASPVSWGAGPPRVAIYQRYPSPAGPAPPPSAADV